MYPSTFKLQETYFKNRYISGLYDMYTVADVRALEAAEEDLGIIKSKAIVSDMVIETGICLRIHPEKGDQIFNGVLNLLNQIGTLQISPEPVKEPHLVQPDQVKMVQAHHSGLFIKQVEAGKFIEKGENIGTLIAPIEGSVLKEIVSPYFGLLFTIREHPLAHKGSPLARIAELRNK